MAKDMESAISGGNLSRRRLLKGAAALGGAYALDKFWPKSVEAMSDWQAAYKNLQVTPAEAAAMNPPLYIRAQQAVLDASSRPTNLFVLRAIEDSRFQIGMPPASLYKSSLVGQEFGQFEALPKSPLHHNYSLCSPDGNSVLLAGSYSPAQGTTNPEYYLAVAAMFEGGKYWSVLVPEKAGNKYFGAFRNIFPVSTNAYLLTTGRSIFAMDVDLALPDYARVKVNPIANFNLGFDSFSSCTVVPKLTNGLATDDRVYLYTISGTKYDFYRHEIDLVSRMVTDKKRIESPTALSTIKHLDYINGVPKGFTMAVDASNPVGFRYFDLETRTSVYYDLYARMDQFPSASEIYLRDVLKIDGKFYLTGSYGVRTDSASPFADLYAYFGVWAGNSFNLLYKESIKDTDGVSMESYLVNGNMVFDVGINPVGKRLLLPDGSQYLWANKGLSAAAPKEEPRRMLAPLVKLRSP